MFKNINISFTWIICLIIIYILYNIYIYENFEPENSVNSEKSELNEVWGVNAANQILKAQLPCIDNNNNNNKCDWKIIGKNLKQVAQSNDKIWGVDTDDNIKYCINTKDTPCSNNEDWQTLPISLKQISVSKDSIWGIDNDNIKYCNTTNSSCEGNDWGSIPGNFKNISIGNNNDVWVIDTENNIKYCNNNKTSPCYDDISLWNSVPHNNLNENKDSSGNSVILDQVSVGNDNIWVIKNNGDVFKCDKPCNGNWIRVPGLLNQISVGKDAIWGVDDKNIKYCINTVNYPCIDNKWININNNLPGKLTNVSIK